MGILKRIPLDHTDPLEKVYLVDRKSSLRMLRKTCNLHFTTPTGSYMAISHSKESTEDEVELAIDQINEYIR